MATDSDKRGDFVTKYANAVSDLLDSMEALLMLKKEHTALDYGNQITQDDLTGDNAYLTTAELTAAVFSIDEADTFLSMGHYTNLYKVAR